MSASNYSFSGIEKFKYQLYSLKLHQKRLKEINKKSARIFNKHPFKIKPRKQFEVLNLNQKDLEKQNLNLLKKLIEIAQTREKSRLRSLTPLPRTLNSVSRKKENQRINIENKRISDRIASQTPVLNLKLLAKDYSAQVRYGQNLRKNSLFNRKRVANIRQLENLEKHAKSQRIRSNL